MRNIAELVATSDRTGLLRHRLLARSKGVRLSTFYCTAVATLLMSHATVAFAGPNPYNQTFTAFESGQVRPIALTPDKKYLLAVNTPDAKLEIFKVNGATLDHRAS